MDKTNEYVVVVLVYLGLLDPNLPPPTHEPGWVSPTRLASIRCKICSGRCKLTLSARPLRLLPNILLSRITRANPHYLSKQSVTCLWVDTRSCDGDGVVVRNSNAVNIDAGKFDE